MKKRSGARMHRRILVLVVLVLAGICIASFYKPTLQQAQSVKNQRHGKRFDPTLGPSQGFEEPKPGCKSCSAEDSRRIYAPTIALSEAGPGKIVLNSRSDDPIEGTAVFYTEDGEKFVGKSFTMKPFEMRFVSIKSLLPDGEEHRTDWGGMDIQYFGGKRELWAQIALPGQGKRGSSDVTFAVIDGLGSDTQEAVWWQPKGKSILALGNSAETAIQTTVSYSDGSFEVVTIPAFATKYIRRNHTQEGSQSVTLNTSGEAGALKAIGYSMSSSTAEFKRFASSIRFYDTKGAVQPKLFANNFRVGSESHMVVRNTSEQSVNLTPTFKPTQGNGESVVLSSFTVHAGQSQEIDLSALRTAAASRDDLRSVSVEIANDGPTGSLIGSLNSRESGNLYDVPLRDSGRYRNSTGAYPWRVDDDYTTVVTLTNTSANDVRLGTYIFFDGGEYQLGGKKLAPGETARFDINEIYNNQVQDERGRVIPLDKKKGQFRWSILGPGEQDRIVGRAEVVSKSRNESISYSCIFNCPWSGPAYDTYPLVIAVFAGSSAQVDSREIWYHPTSGAPYPQTGTLPSINDDNSAIAESAINGSNSTKVDTDGNSGGPTSWYTGTYPYTYWYDNGFDCAYDTSDQYSDGPIDVEPTVTAISPARGGVGGATNVTITGTGFRSGATTIPSITGITVSNVSVQSSTQLTATFTIAGNASAGNRAVKVAVGGTQSSGSVNFYVQVPYKIVYTSVTQESLGCQSGYNGYGAKVTYQLLDEDGQAILRAGLTPEEYFTVNGEAGIEDYAPFATPTTTDASGLFNDIPIGTCSTANYNYCADVVQSFRIKVPVSGGSPVLFYMPTTTTRKDCRDGIRVTVTNVNTTPQVTTLGTVPN